MPSPCPIYIKYLVPQSKVDDPKIQIIGIDPIKMQTIRIDFAFFFSFKKCHIKGEKKARKKMKRKKKRKKKRKEKREVVGVVEPS
jgi:hypothetical protein